MICIPGTVLLSSLKRIFYAASIGSLRQEALSVTSAPERPPSRAFFHQLLEQTTSPLPHRMRGRNIAPVATTLLPPHTALADTGDTADCHIHRHAAAFERAQLPPIGPRQQPLMSLLRHDRSFGSGVDDFP